GPRVGGSIAYGRPGARDAEIVAAARAAGAHDFIVRSRQGYESRVGERGMQLSGGERQRIALARAYLKNAPILILAEPTSSVDLRTEAVILDALERLMRGRTTFVITHRASALTACDTRLQLERGRLAEAPPYLPVTSPRYYGCRAEDPQFAWLFLEDIGDERYIATDRAQLALAGHWVALMHTAAARVPAARGLPDGGPPRYLDHLRADLQTIGANLANPALTAGDAATLGRLASDLDRLEGAWVALERACTGLPATLVHGDLQRKNLYVRNGAGQTALYAIDWETAGWGVPAADVARVDLPTYWSVVRSVRPDVRL